MSLIDKLKNACIQRTIKKGKEKRIYHMIVKANDIVSTEPEIGKKLIKRAKNILEKDIYRIDSHRVYYELSVARIMYRLPDS